LFLNIKVFRRYKTPTKYSFLFSRTRVLRLLFHKLHTIRKKIKCSTSSIKLPSFEFTPVVVYIMILIFKSKISTIWGSKIFRKKKKKKRARSRSRSISVQYRIWIIFHVQNELLHLLKPWLYSNTFNTLCRFW
jgi:hypothetical protein